VLAAQAANALALALSAVANTAANRRFTFGVRGRAGLLRQHGMGALVFILTLGLMIFVVNALMLWITAWITEHTTHWGLYIEDFWWTAIWAAIVLSIVSWLLSLITRDAGRRVRT